MGPAIGNCCNHRVGQERRLLPRCFGRAIDEKGWAMAHRGVIFPEATRLKFYECERTGKAAAGLCIGDIQRLGGWI